MRYTKLLKKILIINKQIDNQLGIEGRKNLNWKFVESLFALHKLKIINNKPFCGAFKRVYIVKKYKNLVALKVCRNTEQVNKELKWYKKCKSPKGHRYCAKFYWTFGRFMLQKYGKEASKEKKKILELKKIGKELGLKDIRNKNILIFNGIPKIIDAILA